MDRRPTPLLATPIGAHQRGHWARLRVRLAAPQALFIPLALLRDAAGKPIGGNLYLRPSAAPVRRGVGWHTAIFFVPPDAVQLEIAAYGRYAGTLGPSDLAFRTVPRWQAALWLLAYKPGAVLDLLGRPVPVRPRMLGQRGRRALAVAAYEFQAVKRNYALWTGLFDTWTEGDFAPSGLGIGYLVMAQDRDGAALHATLASIAAQHGGAPPFAVLDGAALPEIAAEYVGVLQAGEVLPRHATRMAAAELERLGRPDIAITDEDALGPTGAREKPAFKPTPSRALMLSGTLARGLWFLRRALLPGTVADPAWAEALRLRLWLARYEAGADAFSQRIPYVLAHRRPDAEAAPASLLAGIVNEHLARSGAPFEARATWPLGLALRDHPPCGRVTAVVPSTLRQPHSQACVSAILRGTDYPALDLHVAVSQPGPLDAAQERAAQAIRAFPNASVEALAAQRFNFSAVNNRVIERTAGEYVLLLNDDVSPIRPDWLRWMVAFLQDPAVGMVGARLLYPNGRVQHGGVIMGLAGLCDHAWRFLPRQDPGYLNRATLAQELSAVTAACMLVRRSVLERIGGLDEGYPSAFNDVDLALRVREQGYAVVYAPQAELFHHELLTYGNHYAGDRGSFHVEEVARMRARHAAVWRDDPFHNPNLDLVPGLEAEPAYPPRVALPRSAQA